MPTVDEHLSGLIRQIRINEKDTTARLAFADRLEELGGPFSQERAQFIREAATSRLENFDWSTYAAWARALRARWLNDYLESIGLSPGDWSVITCCQRMGRRIGLHNFPYRICFERKIRYSSERMLEAGARQPTIVNRYRQFRILFDGFLRPLNPSLSSRDSFAWGRDIENETFRSLVDYEAYLAEPFVTRFLVAIPGLFGRLADHDPARTVSGFTLMGWRIARNSLSPVSEGGFTVASSIDEWLEKRGRLICAIPDEWTDADLSRAERDYHPQESPFLARLANRNRVRLFQRVRSAIDRILDKRTNPRST